MLFRSRLLIATAAGGLTGGIIASYRDARALAALFAALLVYVAIQMARPMRPPAPMIAIFMSAMFCLRIRLVGAIPAAAVVRKPINPARAA